MPEETREQLRARVERLNSNVPNSFSAQRDGYPLFLNMIDSFAKIADIPTDITPVLETRMTVTNAQLKELNNTYIELVAAPGFRQFIQVTQIWLLKSGNDQPAEAYPFLLYMTVSEDEILSEEEAAIYTPDSSAYSGVDIPNWQGGGSRYLFIGVPTTHEDISGIGGSTSDTSYPDDDDRRRTFSQRFQRYPDIVNVEDVPVKWWRSNNAYNSRSAFIGVSRARGVIFEPSPTLGDIAAYAYLATMLPLIDEEKPLYSRDGEHIWVAGHGLEDLLALSGGTILAEAVGGHGLHENVPLQLGIVYGSSRLHRPSTYSDAVYDQYLENVDDTSIEILVRYQIHSTIDPSGGA